MVDGRFHLYLAAAAAGLRAGRRLNGIYWLRRTGLAMALVDCWISRQAPQKSRAYKNGNLGRIRKAPIFQNEYSIHTPGNLVVMRHDHEAGV